MKTKYNSNLTTSTVTVLAMNITANQFSFELICGVFVIVDASIIRTKTLNIPLTCGFSGMPQTFTRSKSFLNKLITLVDPVQM